MARWPSASTRSTDCNAAQISRAGYAQRVPLAAAWAASPRIRLCGHEAESALTVGVSRRFPPWPQDRWLSHPARRYPEEEAISAVGLNHLDEKVPGCARRGSSLRSHPPGGRTGVPACKLSIRCPNQGG
jgi:hypothetical protein